MNKLPDTPSELVKLAIKDMKLCMDDPRVTLYPLDWARVKWGACSACLAGTIMIKSLGVTFDKSYHYGPSDFPDEHKLASLDELRVFNFHGFLEYFFRTEDNYDISDLIQESFCDKYSSPARFGDSDSNNNKFIEQLEFIVELLQEHNL